LSYEEDGSTSVWSWIAQFSKLDGYCVECSDRTLFFDSRKYRPSDLDTSETAVYVLEYSCGRKADHKLRFWLYLHDQAITKIGQYPSHADLSNPELKKYRSILGAENAGNLHRAIGLASHGVGIGSYVYLRRIFEQLLDAHRREYEAASGTIDGYDGMKVDQRIDALRDNLPEALVKNRTIYGVLSKGIHELSEELCLAIFPVLRDGLVLILEQDRVKRAERERAAQLEKQIAKAASLVAPKGKKQGSEQ